MTVYVSKTWKSRKYTPFSKLSVKNVSQLQNILVTTHKNYMCFFTIVAPLLNNFTLIYCRNVKPFDKEGFTSSRHQKSQIEHFNVDKQEVRMLFYKSCSSTKQIHFH